MHTHLCDSHTQYLSYISSHFRHYRLYKRRHPASAYNTGIRFTPTRASLVQLNSIMTDPLSPEKLLEIIKNAVVVPASSSSTSSSSGGGEASSSSSTTSTTEQSTSSTSNTTATLSNSTSLIALLVHSIHTSLGFRQTRPQPPTIDNEGTTSQDPLTRNRITTDWFENNSKEESFSFEYRHEQSSLVFQVRIGRLGGRIVINAVAVEVSDETALNEHVSIIHTHTHTETLMLTISFKNSLSA